MSRVEPNCESYDLTVKYIDSYLWLSTTDCLYNLWVTVFDSVPLQRDRCFRRTKICTILSSHVNALINEIVKWWVNLWFPCVCSFFKAGYVGYWNPDIPIAQFLTFLVSIQKLKQSHQNQTPPLFWILSPVLLQPTSVLARHSCCNFCNAASAELEMLPWIFLENEWSWLNSLSFQKYVKKQQLEEIFVHWVSHWKVNPRTFSKSRRFELGVWRGSELDPRSYVSLPSSLSILGFFPSSFFSTVFMRFFWTPSSLSL